MLVVLINTFLDKTDYRWKLQSKYAYKKVIQQWDVNMIDNYRYMRPCSCLRLIRASLHIHSLYIHLNRITLVRFFIHITGILKVN